jgi:hypothetical protein
MTVLYFISPSILNIAIKVINVLNKNDDFHVLIEITLQSKLSNIFKVDNLLTLQSIIAISDTLKKEKYNDLVNIRMSRIVNLNN